ncbi:MAG: hypothetical protein VXY78_06315, partial [Pseudomonadota bacterium]|nr:hypothetical protein [Pseudomonadota bacterium]
MSNRQISGAKFKVFPKRDHISLIAIALNPPRYGLLSPARSILVPLGILLAPTNGSRITGMTSSTLTAMQRRQDD